MCHLKCLTFFGYFKLLKERKLTLSSRERASKEVKKYEERTAILEIKGDVTIFLTGKQSKKPPKYALKNGVTASLQHFKEIGKFDNIKESTMHGF